MDIARLRKAWAERSPGLRSFQNWVLCWLLLPNLGYWLLWTIGAPPRPGAVLVTGFAGIFVQRAPFPIKFLTFILAVIVGASFFVSALFNLSILSLVHSLEFAGELSPSASWEYVICGVAVAGTLVAAWHLLHRPTQLVGVTKFAAAASLTVLAASLDGRMSRAAVGTYERIPDPSAPFASAVNASGFDRSARGDRHLVVVMVEAMGEPTDPRIRQKLIDLFATAEVRARYQVTSGNTLFYGSTTSGEMRELCGRWADYREVLEKRDPNCLPARLAASGYQTQAWHSFKGSMFDRTRWYPNIGFQSMRFGPEMQKGGAEACPGVFVGACDRDVPRQIAANLKAARSPQFLYWLTLNSHLPVLKNKQLRTEECNRFDRAFALSFPMSCRLLGLFRDVGSALSKEISAPDFPATDILIVGDHLPPFFDRKNREQFQPDRVPWILLRAKEPVESGQQPAPTRN